MIVVRLRVLLALLCTMSFGCQSSASESQTRLPVSTAHKRIILADIAREFSKNRAMWAPVLLPVRDRALLGELVAEHIVAVRSSSQVFTAHNTESCIHDVPNCREVVVGRLDVSLEPSLFGAYETPQTSENSPTVAAWFSFTGTVTSGIGRIGVREGYWSTYNAMGKACPIRIRRSTIVFLGTFSAYVNNIEFTDPVRADPGLEVASLARPPKPNEFACQSQYLAHGSSAQ